MLFGDRQMSVCPTPVADRRQRAGVTLLCRYLPHHVLTLPRLSPNVAEAEEGERCPIRARVVLAIWSVAAEVDKACLVGMERELVPSKTLAQCILNVCERHHGVISKTDKGTVPLEPRFHRVLEPLIQHMMQEDVRYAGRDHPTLRGAFGRMAPEPVFQHSCLQPFTDHHTDDTIRDSSVKKRTQVEVRNRIEIFFDVEIYHPTQPVAHEASTQRLQGLMSRATRPEAVRAGKKVLLIDGLQDHDDRPLRHLVLEGWKAEWPKRSGSIALGDVDPPDRWRLVAARLDALQEVRKIGLQALRILGRCHTIDTGSTILAGKPVGLPHPFQVEDVVQCGQSHPAFGSCKISYPLPFRGQVCKAQGPLPCCPSAVLSSRRPPSLDWVPASPVPQRHKHYEGATTPT